jgi:hypothetical protein
MAVFVNYRRRCNPPRISQHNLYFIDSKAGWVNDAVGVLLSTTDGNWNWSQQRLGNKELTLASFLEETGFLQQVTCGDTIQRRGAEAGR